MNEKLQWKKYDSNDDTNWGLELTEPVPAGTMLLQVPHTLVLRADSLQDEFLESDGDNLRRALERLGDFEIHTQAFLIVLKLLRQCKKEDSQWAPWIEAMPKSFPEFSSAEKECMPMYAKAAADYQDQKFKAFCAAAKELGEWKEDDPQATELLKWAFNAVSSRFWKTEPKTVDQKATSELVPIGDMFNHREPANVAITHGPDSVNFVYKGDANDDKALYISYGSSYNPHRFMVVFGFCPEMPEVWSHLHYPNNPFSEDASKMVFRTADGGIPENVWDAVLYALLDQPGMSFDNPKYTKEEMHQKYRKYTTTVLRNHVNQNLEHLKELRQKIETTEGENLDLIRQHNEFLTQVFSRVQANLEADGEL